MLPVVAEAESSFTIISILVTLPPFSSNSELFIWQGFTIVNEYVVGDEPAVGVIKFVTSSELLSFTTGAVDK